MNPLHPRPDYFDPSQFVMTLNSEVDIYRATGTQTPLGWFYIWTGVGGNWFYAPARMWSCDGSGYRAPINIEDQLAAYTTLIS